MATDVREDLDLDRGFLTASQKPMLEAAGADRIGIVDLFSGCGGLSVGAVEGARRAGCHADVMLAVDHWKEALEVLGLSLGVPEDRLLGLDLGDVLGGLAADVRATERPIIEAAEGSTLLVAGPPCQGHSALNNRTRHDDARNELYLAVARVARLTMPRAVIVENVRGVGRDRRKAVELCTAALEELGYEVVPKLLDLHQLGAAQRRVRHVLVATREGRFKIDDLPSVEGRDLKWAIGDLASIDGRTMFDTASVPSDENRQRMEWLFRHDAYDLPNAERPVCHQSDHTYVSMYGRLRWDKPSQTITSGFGSMGQGRFVHPAVPRTLTPHEAARLQFLPDFMDFSLVEHRSSLATMIGNAAPPILTVALVQALIEQELL